MADLKTSEYPTTITLLDGTDLIDVSENLGGGSWQSSKMSYSVLLSNLNSDLTFSNLYTADGTLTGARTITQGTNLIRWSGGNTQIDDLLGVGLSPATLGTPAKFNIKSLADTDAAFTFKTVDTLDQDIFKISEAGSFGTDLLYFDWTNERLEFALTGDNIKISDSASTSGIVSGSIIIGNSTTAGNLASPSSVIIGHEAFDTASTNCTGSTVVGFQAARLYTNNPYIVAIGYKAANTATTASSLVAIGREAARLASSPNNVCVGDRAGYTFTGGTGDNTIVGTSAFFEPDGSKNVVMGRSAMAFGVTLNSNVAIGNNCMVGVSVTSSYNLNVAIGDGTLQVLEGASANTCVGATSMILNTDGIGNVVAGYNSLTANIDGDHNVILGKDAATFLLGNRNIFIGFAAGSESSITNYDDTLIIASSGGSPLVYGNLAGSKNFRVIGDFEVASGALFGTANMTIRSNGTIQPVSLADVSAANDSIYYSTTASRLVYKDSGGVVNNLY